MRGTETQTATELSEGVWWLDLGSVNCYVVEDGDELVLVDAGMPWNATDIRDGIRDTGHTVRDVSRVLVTHFDLDHVGALSKLGLDAPVYVGREDAYVLAGERRPTWQNHKGLLQRVATTFVATPDLPIRLVDDGDEIGSFTAYHTPGHSPGHVVYVAQNPSVALLGDLVAESDGALEPTAKIIDYDYRELKASILDLADRAPDFDVAAMGHGTPFVRRGGERLQEVAARIDVSSKAPRPPRRPTAATDR